MPKFAVFTLEELKALQHFHELLNVPTSLAARVVEVGNILAGAKIADITLVSELPTEKKEVAPSSEAKL